MNRDIREGMVAYERLLEEVQIMGIESNISEKIRLFITQLRSLKRYRKNRRMIRMDGRCLQILYDLLAMEGCIIRRN